MALVYGIGATLACEIVLAGLNALDGIYPWHVMVLHVTNLFAALALFAGAAIAAAAARRLDRLPVMIVGLATFSLIIFLVQLAFSFVWPNSSGGNLGVVILLNYWVVRNSLRLGMGWSILIAILLVALMTGAGLLILFGTADGQYLLPALMEAREAHAS